jgi:hypothetical protein
MAKKQSSKRKGKSTAFVKNANYATKGAGNNPTKTGAIKTPTQEVAISRTALANARKMAKIEAYAKEHDISLAQAMVHFMK